MRGAGLVLLTALATACANGPQAAPVAALLVAPTRDDHAGIEAAAAALVGTSSMTLAESAFVLDPEVGIEPRPVRSLDGLADGRRRTPALILRLERDGDGCLLRRLDTDASLRLAGVRCVAAADRSMDGDGDGRTASDP